MLLFNISDLTPLQFVFIILFLLAVIVLIIVLGSKPFVPEDFPEWIQEVRVNAIYYGFTPEEIKALADDPSFEVHFENGLTPTEAMKKYFRKLHHIPEAE